MCPWDSIENPVLEWEISKWIWSKWDAQRHFQWNKLCIFRWFDASRYNWSIYVAFLKSGRHHKTDDLKKNTVIKWYTCYCNRIISLCLYFFIFVDVFLLFNILGSFQQINYSWDLDKKENDTEIKKTWNCK